ncbi:MAG: ABC transporter substrate-binding protein [Rhodoglobus sp.]
MKTQRRIIAFAAALTLTGSMAACSATGGSSGESDSTTLTILTGTIVEQPDGEVEQSIADAYMAANPNVKIEYIGVPSNELKAKLTAMASSGTVPDIFFNSPEFVAKSVDLGIPADLNDLLGSEFVDGFAESGIEQSTIDDSLVMAPWFAIPTGLIYRADWFEEEGLTPPTTWDEFTDAAQKLTGDTDGDNATDRWGIALLGSSDASGAGRFIPVLRSFGAVELEADGDSWETSYDSPEGERAFQLYGDLVNKYQVTPAGTLSTSYAEAVSLMSSGKTAMMVSGSNAIGAILAQNPELDGKLAAVAIPHAPGHESAANMALGGYSISESSEHKEAAADFLKFLMNDDNLVKWSNATGRLPMRTDTLESISSAESSLSGFVDAIPYGYAPPQAIFYSAVQTAATEAYQSVILQQATAKEAAAAAAAATREEIANAR